jgi:predicted Zn-dependent protease
MRRPPSLLAPLAALVLLAAAAPATAQRVSNPDLYRKSLQVAAKALELFGASDDRQQIERVADIGYRVAQAANYDDFPFTFHVVEMAAPNAFALPGGQVFVTRGMLDMGIDDDELAGLLGHEVAHVVRQHGIHMQRRATLMQVLSQVLVVGVLVKANQQRNQDQTGIHAPYDPRVGVDDRGGSMVQGTAATSLVVSELLLRGYSRDFEREADDEGQRYAAGAGFDPAGLKKVMALMQTRLPESKEYGYWQTHPFFEERVRASQVRADILTRQPEASTDAYRQRTQAALLDFLDHGKPDAEAVPLLKSDALVSWPRGAKAAELRLERLHQIRDGELAKKPLYRNYGDVVTAYRKELAEVERLDPESSLVATLRDELGGLSKAVADLYPQAAEVVAGGIYETAFLETFLANYPDAAEVPRVALALGDAYSRVGEPAEAVTQYLKAGEAGPDSPEGKRALQGLRNLAPALDDLSALAQLAAQDRDGELRQLAAQRLGKVATTYSDLANGAEYLRRYPAGEQVAAVTTRLNALADNLYAEVVLYQGIGDGVKALDRINKILTSAPASPAAEQIRDRAVVGS